LPPSCSSVDNASLTCSPSAAGTYTISVRVNDTYMENTTTTSMLVVRSPASTPGPSGLSSMLVWAGFAAVGVVAIVVVVWAVRRSRRKGFPPSPAQPPRSPGPPPST
jgi:hypothetical protein